jgi:cell division protein FtsZ
MGLSKPQNIYAEQPSSFVAEPMVSMVVAPAPIPVAAAPVHIPTPAPVQAMEFIHREEPEEMQLVMKESTMPQASTAIIQNNYHSEDNYLDETEEQKRRAAERIQKLRNLSYNLNTTDPNNEFDSVPAYIRRNMELFGNSITSVENFYSKVTVSKDSNNQTQLSTINTFLDGKKPD